MTSSQYDIEGLYDNESQGGSAAVGPSVGGKGAGVTRETKSSSSYGKARGANAALFPFDRKDAYVPGRVQVWHVSKADRMEVGEAARTLQAILDMFGLSRENAPVQAGFLDAMLFCHTINSGSTLQPGRSKIYLDATGTGFDFQAVVQFLGADLRRFFRAYADETRRVNKKVIAGAYNIDDPAAQDRFNWLMQVASERDLMRYPELAHDSADACSALTPNERSALAVSKKSIFSEIVNVADSITANGRTRASHNPYSSNPAMSRGNE